MSYGRIIERSIPDVIFSKSSKSPFRKGEELISNESASEKEHEFFSMSERTASFQDQNSLSSECYLGNETTLMTAFRYANT